jgi:hypothetical protein
MSYELRTPGELDDAAFRARLAPLASEVLPPQSVNVTLDAISRSRRRHIVVIVGLGASIVVLSVAGVVLQWTAPGRAISGPPSLRIDPPVIETAAKTVVQPGARSDPALPASPAPRASNDAAAEMVELLLRRGNAAIADGDFVAARLLYEHAASLGSATAATAMGKTYDIEFLLRSGARGIPADQSVAAAWYRKAAALGDVEARARLVQIETRR